MVIRDVHYNPKKERGQGNSRPEAPEGEDGEDGNDSEDNGASY